MGAQMKTPIAQALFRWRRSSLAETDARDLVSAPCYRGPEHVGIAAVVVAKLKLSDVERQIFGTHLVECVVPSRRAECGSHQITFGLVGLFTFCYPDD